MEWSGTHTRAHTHTHTHTHATLVTSPPLLVRHVIKTMHSRGVRYVIEEWAAKCQRNSEVMEAIKEQGNKHTKELQYRAAIADYTRAIRMK